MDEQRDNSTSTDRDWPWLLVLFLLVLTLRCWLFFNTEVTARDSIGFIRYALQFEQMPWGDVLRGQHQHPGFAFAVWATSLPLRAWQGETTPLVMQQATQLVSMIAALLLILPTYYMGKTLKDQRIGFMGALLFQFLPVSGHHLSDGVSESMFFLFLAGGLCFMGWALESNRRLYFVLAGASMGLSYLVRPEGALVLAASVGCLMFIQLVPGWRRTWGGFVLNTGALCVAAALVGSIYVAATGRITNKLSARIILESTCAPVGGPLTASMFKPGDTTIQQAQRTLQAIGAELVQGFHYVVGLTVLVGLLGWRRWRSQRTYLLGMIYFALQTLILFALGMKMSYVSDRHVMVLVMLGSYVAALGIEMMAERLSAFAKPRMAQASLSWMMLLALIAIGLPRTCQRLHANRVGNVQAGLWLAERMHRGDIIDDDHCWTHFYAGQVFLETKVEPVAADVQPTCFVVITRSTNAEVDGKRRGQEQSLRQDRGQLVYFWPSEQGAEKARVVVYALPRNPKTHPWPVERAPRMVPAQTVSLSVER